MLIIPAKTFNTNQHSATNHKLTRYLYANELAFQMRWIQIIILAYVRHTAVPC